MNLCFCGVQLALVTVLGPVLPVIVPSGAPADELDPTRDPRLVYPTDLDYLGAFRFPESSGTASTWSYGGGGMTYCPTGDPNGEDDGFPGSLFAVSHVYHELVAEISIPAPVLSPGLDAAELPAGATLQPFADITGGMKENLGRLGDIAFLPPQGAQAAPKIYWTTYEYYNADGTDNFTHGWSELDLSDPRPRGLWHVGPRDDSDYHSMKTAGYVFDVPEAWADLNLGGKYLVSGRHRENGAFGGAQGPALVAFAPYQDGNPPGPGAELDATVLLLYPTGMDRFPDYCADDEWTGGAWVTAGDRSTVLLVGSKGLGESYYGIGRPGDCASDKGFHCDPYEAQFLFYDPDELAEVARGQRQPYEVLPYAILRPGDFWPACRAQPTSVAYDRERGYLFVVQHNATVVADAPVPLVHVWKIQGGSVPGSDPGTQNGAGSGGSSAGVLGGVSVAPNPFFSATTISLEVAGGAPVANVAIYDVSGRRVRDFGRVSGGSIQWNARGFPGGLYFLRIRTGDRVITEKLSLIR